MKLPLPTFLQTPAQRSAVAWNCLRFLLVGLIAAHGWTRLTTGGVLPFGEWLSTQGLPLGVFIAASITGIEILGTVLMALRILVAPLCVLYSAIYAAGIYLVHAPEGWFVVGYGRNGAEYSVLLIVCLICVGLQHVRVEQ